VCLALYDNLTRMQVQVLFFGGLREILACQQTVVQCPGERASIATVRAIVEGQFSKLEAFRDTTRLALNEEFVALDDLGTTELRDGDVLAFIPPVTGG
jgi:molybdopterin converting factor subunit 1